MNRLTILAVVLLVAALATAFPLAAPGGLLSLGVLAAGALLGAAFAFAPLRAGGPLSWLLLFLFLAADGGALALAAKGAPLAGLALADLVLPIAHALLVLAFVEAAHAANRSTGRGGGVSVDLTVPFLKQAALALPVVAGLLAAGALLGPLFADALLPAALSESYEVGSVYGLALSLILVSVLAYGGYAASTSLARTLASARARRAATPPTTPTEEESP